MTNVTFCKMSNVYLTLVSDVSADYAGNVANKFKVNPQLRLHGEGWKVSIVSAILPKMALFKELQSETKNLMEFWFDVDGVSGAQKRKKGHVDANDLKAMEKEHKCRTGVEFMNEVKALIDERRQAQIVPGKKIKSGHWTKLAWKRDASEPELVIEHSTAGVTNLIGKKFAESMMWMNTTNNVHYYSGPNMVITYPSQTRDVSELINREPTYSDSSWLYLSGKPDYRLTNLNATFVDALNLHARPLTVTANVTANKETVPQSLGQVYYAPEGRERYLFTPPVEEFYEVQTNHWDEVELTLKELNESAVEFQPDSQCLIRLHFKKD